LTAPGAGNFTPAAMWDESGSVPDTRTWRRAVVRREDVAPTRMWRRAVVAPGGVWRRPVQPWSLGSTHPRDHEKRRRGELTAPHVGNLTPITGARDRRGRLDGARSGQLHPGSYVGRIWQRARHPDVAPGVAPGGGRREDVAPTRMWRRAVVRRENVAPTRMWRRAVVRRPGCGADPFSHGRRGRLTPGITKSGAGES
jgi:hypothetical protein